LSLAKSVEFRAIALCIVYFIPKGILGLFVIPYRAKIPSVIMVYCFSITQQLQKD